MNYTVHYHKEIPKDLSLIPVNIQSRIKRAIESRLLIDPSRYGNPLRRSLKGYRKMRVGDYRIIYKIQNNSIFILKIGNRKEVYIKGRRMRKSIYLILFIVFLCGCATIGSVPGNTRADVVLQSDIIQTIGFSEKTQGGSLSPKIIDTNLISSKGASMKEKWTVNRKGKEVDYIVILIPDPRGGTAISVVLEN